MTPYVGITLCDTVCTVSTLHAILAHRMWNTAFSKRAKDPRTHLGDQGDGQQNVVSVAHAHGHACEAWGPGVGGES